MTRGVKNDVGIFGARKGSFMGKEYIFTHRNPKNGKLWCEDISTAMGVGTWVSSERVWLK